VFAFPFRAVATEAVMEFGGAHFLLDRKGVK
jgi:hypothetical protein